MASVNLVKQANRALAIVTAATTRSTTVRLIVGPASRIRDAGAYSLRVPAQGAMFVNYK